MGHGPAGLPLMRSPSAGRSRRCGGRRGHCRCGRCWARTCAGVAMGPASRLGCVSRGASTRRQRARHSQRRRGPPFPARRQGFQRRPPAHLPLPRPAPRKHGPQPPPAPPRREDHARCDGLRGLPRNRDSDPLEKHPRRRARLSRSLTPHARSLLRASAGPADFRYPIRRFLGG